MPGVDGVVSKMLAWDPPGPTPPRILIVGAFRAAGTQLLHNVALFDPATATFTSLSGGTDGDVNDASIQPVTNNLVIAGTFASAGGVQGTAGVAMHDGTSFLSLGGGLPQSQCVAVAAAGGGAIFVSGTITSPVATSLAVFNGTAWTAMNAAAPNAPNSTPTKLAANGNGVVGLALDFTVPGPQTAVFTGDASLSTFNLIGRSAGISSLLVRNGAVIIGGSFANMPSGGIGPSVSLLASRGVGGVWGQLPTVGLTAIGAGISSLSLLDNNEILLGGTITIGASTGVARLTAGPVPTLLPLLGGVRGEVASGAQLPGSNTVFVGGPFDGVLNGANNTAAAGFAGFTGAAWNVFGVNDGVFGDAAAVPSLLAVGVNALYPVNTNFVVGGRFTQAGGVAANNIAVLRDALWSPLGAGFDGPVNAIAQVNGELFAGGQFTNSGPVVVNRLARWTGSGWRDLNGSIAGPGLTEVNALVARGTNELVVGGNFATAGGVVCNNIAVWSNSTGWRALGTGLLGRVESLAVLPNGNILAGGGFNLAGATVFLVEFDGTTWRAAPGLDGTVRALLTEPSGTVLLGGSFTTDGTTVLNGIARWDGTTFSALGSGVGGVPGAAVYALTLMADGDVLVGGHFTTAGGNVALNIARFDGTWSGFGRGTDAPVRALSNLDDLVVGVGGLFTRAHGGVACRISTLVSTCRPAVAPYTAAGCQSLVADNWPLIGARFRATASGVPSGALAFGVVGASQVSLPFAFPNPSCVQLVSLDLIEVFLPTSSTLKVSFAINNDPVLIGGLLHYQVAYPTIDSTGAIIAIGATNGLRLTVGSF